MAFYETFVNAQTFAVITLGFPDPAELCRTMQPVEGARSLS